MTEVSRRTPVAASAPEGTTEPAGPRRSETYRALLVAVDCGAAVVALGISVGMTLGSVAFLVAVAGADLFDRRPVVRLGLSALDDAPRVAFRGVLAACIAAAAGLLAYGHPVSGRHHTVDLLGTVGLYTVVAVVGRGIGYAALRRLQASGWLRSPALIVGAGRVGTKLGRRLSERPEYGIVPLGFVDRTLPGTPHSLPAPLLGDVWDLPTLVAEHGVHHVFVTFGSTPDADLVDAIRACDRLDCEIFVVPRLFEVGAAGSLAVEHIWGLPLVRLRRASHRGRMWTMKRILDVVCSFAALVAASPVMLAVALAVRLEIGSPVLFRQVRIGLDGQPFELLKFRTLRPQPEDETSGWSVVSADRLGRFGRFLRRSSLDELPQLWNVLRGEMSLVGPRPEQPRYVAQFARKHAGYEARLRVPAGVTGLAQINGLRGATSIEERVRFDNLYIEHWSLWQDIKILVRTAVSVIGMRGG